MMMNIYIPLTLQQQQQQQQQKHQQKQQQICMPPSIYAPMRRCPVRKFKRTISDTNNNNSQTRTIKKVMQQPNSIYDNINNKNCLDDQRMIENFIIIRRRAFSVSIYDTPKVLI